MNRDNTAELLKKYVGSILSRSGVEPLQAADKLEEVFGEDIHRDVADFIEYALANDLKDEVILLQLTHDIQGAFNNDDLMVPRVSSFGKTKKKGKKGEAVATLSYRGVDKVLNKLIDFVAESVALNVEMDINTATREDILPLLDELNEDEEWSAKVGEFGFSLLEENIAAVIDAARKVEVSEEVD